MNDFFNTVGNMLEVHGIGTFGTVAIIAVIVTFLGLWTALAEKHWVAYSLNPTPNSRAEFVVALFAPVTVPALAVMVAIKWTLDRKNIAA